MDEEQNKIIEGSSRPPGFRFYPTEEELLGFYLHEKLHSRREEAIDRVIPVAHVHLFDPWQLPQISGESSVRDSEQWFFFCARQERETHGGRPARTTPSGYWKATGSPGLVYSSSNRPMGVKKTMVFYRGRAPTGTKTKWKMNEYRAFEDDSTQNLRSEFSLCRVYIKSGCLRSFDRRPSDAAPPAGASSRIMLDAAASDDRNPSAAKRSRSLDSSPSDGHGDHNSTNGGAMDWKILDELEWDPVDWV